jgi:ankyrin repeat protein
MALSKALLNKDDEAVKALLDTGECDPNCFVSGGPALFLCMSSLQQRNFRALLNTGKCDLNLTNPSNAMTPLMQAACQGLSAYVEALLEETDACQLKDSNDLDGMTPLFYAARKGHTGVVIELLADGRCDVDSPHLCGKTSLSMAVEGRHRTIVELLLLSSHQKSTVPRVLRKTALEALEALDSAAAKLKELRRVEKLLSNVWVIRSVNIGLVPTYPDHPLDSPTFVAVTGTGTLAELLACKLCHLSVNPLCRRCPDIVWRTLDSRHRNPIRSELNCAYTDVDTDLLRAFDERDDGSVSRARGGLNSLYHIGITPLMLAVARSPDDHPIVDALLRTKGCDVNAEDIYGWTALIHAGYHEKTWHVESLLGVSGCRIDKPLMKGYPTTVLHMAAYLDRPQFLRQLLELTGLDLRVQNNLGQTPLIVATTRSRRDNVELLLGYGAGCGADMRSTQGNTALCLAVLLGDYEIVCLILDSCKAKDLADKSGKHLSLVAKERGNADIERVLLEYADTLRTLE